MVPPAAWHRSLKNWVGRMELPFPSLPLKGIIARELGMSPAELDPATSRAPMRPLGMEVFAREVTKADK